MRSRMPVPRRAACASVALSALALTTMVALAGCSSTEPTTAAPATTAATVATTAGSSAAPGTVPGSTPAGTGTVTVKTFTFKPSPVTVAVGQPVTWQNQDDILHEPTAGTPAAKSDAFKTVELDGKGSSGSVTFTAPGTYPYFCAVHESMVGEIVVT